MQGFDVWEVHRKNGPQDPVADGTLRWFTNDEAVWQPLTAATGWQRFLDPAHKNQVTMESGFPEDRIYAIGANGELRLYRWKYFERKWENPDGDVIDQGWDKYNSITASENGVIYARTADGRLMRFRYDAKNRTWTQRDKQIATGWNAFDQILSPGGDILYGTGATKDGVPTLRWFQYYAELDTWAPGSDPDGLGKIVGQGERWSKAYQFTTDSTICQDKAPR
jgi:hypothetical protein